MTFPDYPGTFWAILSFVAAGAVTFWAYRGRTVAKLGLVRWGLALMTFLPLCALIVLSWNPSRVLRSERTEPCSALVFFDTSESMSTTDDTRETRLDRAVARYEACLEPDAGARPYMRLFGFDETCYAAATPARLERWGQASRLEVALDAIPQWGPGVGPEGGATGGPLGGILIITDGQFGGARADAYLVQADPGVPVVIAGVGSEARPADVSVAALTVPARAALHAEYPVTATVLCNGLAGRTVRTRLIVNEHVVETRELEVRDEEMAVDVAFACRPSAPGRDVIEVACDLGAFEERNRHNNRRRRLVEIVPQETRKVLLYAEAATMDLGKVRRALAQDEKVSLEFRLNALRNPAQARGNPRGVFRDGFPETEEELHAFDLVVLGPVEWRRWDEARLERLHRYVAQRGGGLLFLPGLDTFSPGILRSTRWADLLPVRFDPDGGPVLHPVLQRPAVTPEAEALHLFADLDGGGDPEPTLAWYAGIEKKPAASTYLSVAGLPLVSVHRVGRGRCGLLNSRLLHLWYDAGQDGGFLSELIAALSGSLGSVPLEASRIEAVARYEADEDAVYVEAFVRDAAYEPVTFAMVLLEAGGEVVRMQAGSPGRYSARLPAPREASLLARVKAEQAGKFLGERTLVLDLPEPEGEMARVHADKAFLQDLADRFGGTYTDLEALEPEHLAGFQAERVTQAAVGVLPVWRRWPLVLALCAWLTVTWFLRRSKGLI